MSVYGESEPKFVVGSTTVELDYSKILKFEPIDRVLVNTSEIDGKRYFYTKSYNFIFEVRINLFKYGSISDKYEEIMEHLHQEVTLYPFRDHDPIKNVNGEIIPFVFTRFRSYFLETASLADQLVLTFESTEPIDLLSTTLVTLITEKGEDIVTEDGQLIVAL